MYCVSVLNGEDLVRVTRGDNYCLAFELEGRRRGAGITHGQSFGAGPSGPHERIRPSVKCAT
jgi:hypothetical protein